jgi:MFS family permease
VNGKIRESNHIELLCQSLVIRSNASLWCFLAARALTGTFAGSSPVSKAYLADVGCKDGNLPRYLALRDAASTMAFIVGPVLGGIIYDIRGRASRVSESAVLRTSAFSSNWTRLNGLERSLSALPFTRTILVKNCVPVIQHRRHHVVILRPNVRVSPVEIVRYRYKHTW